jgi:hypothetical protein
MQRKLTRRLVIPMLLAGGSFACSPASAGCPAEVAADSTSCRWEVDRSTGERKLRCRVGDQTFRVDTSGVGEG